MKKLLNLQLFADDPTPAEPPKADEPKVDEPKNDDKPKVDEPKVDEPKKYTDADVDKIIDRKFAEWEKKKQKEVDEAKKLADMNAQEKLEYEKKQLQKELDEYRQKDTLAEMTKTARKMLTDENINISDDLLSVMVTTDAEETKSAINGFTKMYKEAVESGVKEKLKGTPPKASTGGGSPMSEIDRRIAKYQ